MRKLAIDELNRIDIETFKQEAKIPLIIVLENIRSLNNIGAIFRTADAFKVEEILLCGITARPPHREIQKTALGATESVDWKHFAELQEGIDYIKQKGYKIASIEQAEGSTSLEDINALEKKGWAIVLGNEVEGVEQSTIDQSDVCIEIPQYGTKHSLNVAICGGILTWEFFKHLS